MFLTLLGLEPEPIRSRLRLATNSEAQFHTSGTSRPWFKPKTDTKHQTLPVVNYDQLVDL